ncbi:MAG: hypothetical protein KOO63_12230 [Bacteroidales bacterium]|nr:hypothetical protein [Candidatus Latescibacterota bacterium]
MKTRRKSLKSVWMSVIGLAAPVLFLAITLMPSIALAEERQGGKKNLREKKYYYQAFNRRDPFTSLIAGEFEESEFDLVDIYGVKLVGVLSGGMDKYAMLEDKNGFGYIIKAGDPIRNGSIISVGDRALVARLTMFGQTTSVTLRLEGKTGKGE